MFGHQAARGLKLRIGQGFDAHKFVQGRKLMLGGEEIDYPSGLEGHSDADVVIHALIDALLGAAGLGDIGMHFPDTDPAHKDAAGMDMLEIIVNALHSLNYRIINVDITIFAQKPKIGPYRAAMVGNIASVLSLEPEMVNVKATTTEGMGFVGRQEGIAASAVALIGGAK
jgi:2-C-methyl-D-erythritol 2,4-cyclodiphosphate synthase